MNRNLPVVLIIIQLETLFMNRIGNQFLYKIFRFNIIILAIQRILAITGLSTRRVIVVAALNGIIGLISRSRHFYVRNPAMYPPFGAITVLFESRTTFIRSDLKLLLPNHCNVGSNGHEYQTYDRL